MVLTAYGSVRINKAAATTKINEQHKVRRYKDEQLAGVSSHCKWKMDVTCLYVHILKSQSISKGEHVWMSGWSARLSADAIWGSTDSMGASLRHLLIHNIQSKY